MGQLFVLMCVHNNQNTFVVLEFSNLTIFDPKICFNNFWEGKYYKNSSSIQTHDQHICSQHSNSLGYAVS